jgi:hypothetical protein
MAAQVVASRAVFSSTELVCSSNFRLKCRLAPTDLFLPIASANLFLIIFVLTTKGSPCGSVLYLGDATLTAEYRRVIYIQGVSFFYRVSNESSIQSEIKLGNFRFVASCFSELRHHVPSTLFRDVWY